MTPLIPAAGDTSAAGNAVLFRTLQRTERSDTRIQTEEPPSRTICTNVTSLAVDYCLVGSTRAREKITKAHVAGAFRPVTTRWVGLSALLTYSSSAIAAIPSFTHLSLSVPPSHVSTLVPDLPRPVAIHEPLTNATKTLNAHHALISLKSRVRVVKTPR